MTDKKLSRKEQRELEKAKQEQIEQILGEWKTTRAEAKKEEAEIKNACLRLAAKRIRESDLRAKCNSLAEQVLELTKDEDGFLGEGPDGTVYSVHEQNSSFGVVDEMGRFVMVPVLDDDGEPVTDGETGEPVTEVKMGSIKQFRIRTHKPPRGTRKLSL